MTIQGKILQIYDIRDNRYYFNDNIHFFWSIKECDEKSHLWSIQDAKDGDVLCTYECCEPKIVFILKGTPKKHYALSYHCYYNIMYPYFASDSEKGCLAPNDKDVKSATKEQRDALTKVMADAGFTFDFERKELNNIEKNHAWSEEDEEMIDNIIDYMKPMPIFFESTKGKSGKEYTKEFVKNAINWLKSLKVRSTKGNV